jgi:hypothetical protein
VAGVRTTRYSSDPARCAGLHCRLDLAVIDTGAMERNEQHAAGQT